MPKEFFVIVRELVWAGKRPRRTMPRGKVFFWLCFRHWKFLLCSVPFRGICAVARGPRLAVGSRQGRGFLHWRFPVMKKKSASSAAANAKHVAAVETDLFAQLFPLVEHCAATSYDDGDPREPGWITVKTQGAAWVVQVKDPDSAMSFTSVAESLDKALQTAALLLSCDEAPWTPDQWLKSKKKK